MLRKLLVERFKIADHFEDRETPVYTLEPVKQGLRLKESTGSADRPCTDRSVPPGLRTYECHHVPMQMLVSLLPNVASDYLDRPVINLTNLKGEYDISLRWSTRLLTDSIADIGPAGADASERPTIFQALSQQLGLTLSPRKYPLASLVIDHVERLEEH